MLNGVSRWMTAGVPSERSVFDACSRVPVPLITMGDQIETAMARVKAGTEIGGERR